MNILTNDTFMFCMKCSEIVMLDMGIKCNYEELEERTLNLIKRLNFIK